jgi:isopenicillin N synthase-like dioxygenase
VREETLSRKIPELDLREWHDPMRRSDFVRKMGEALEDIGFFALNNHSIDLSLIESAYANASVFFALPEAEKLRHERLEIQRQRGFVPFGVEHAKGNLAPDLKEFWQSGRTLPIDHPKADEFPTNIWPEEILPGFQTSIDGLFCEMEKLSRELLCAASQYLGKPEKWLSDMAEDGNTILRVIHYPPISSDAPPGAIRSAQHEDINFITLLVGSTADGLEVMDHDGSWIKVGGNHHHIIVDSGDMLQSLTNGLFKSTTHRVINPDDNTSDRFSMPLFVHPHNDIDLTPRPEFIAITGGDAKYPTITAGEYLRQRLEEIGLTSN